MTVMVQAVNGDTHVATAALRAYAARHERVAEVPLVELLAGAAAPGSLGVKAVAVADLRVVEVVVPDEVVCEGLASSVWALAAQGWDVVVLLPLHRLGEGHGGLRGVPCRLQSWWMENGEVSFGSCEIP